MNSRLTDRLLKTISVGQGEPRQEIPDGGGLFIRVSHSGGKTWIMRLRIKGVLTTMTMGHYPTMSLAAARSKAAEIRLRIKNGEDPDPQKTADRNSPTVSVFVQEYLERWAIPHKKTWAEDKRVLEKDFIPYAGSIKMTKLTRRDIVAVLDKIRDRGSYTGANRTLAIIRRMCRFAVERGLIEQSPAIYIKATPEDSRDRALSREELRQFFAAMQKESPWIGTRLALEILLRTGQRSSEVLFMSPRQVDLGRAIWIIPGELVKNGREQVVPLPRQVVTLLKIAMSTTSSQTAMFRTPVLRASKKNPDKANDFMSKQSLGRAMTRALKRNGVQHATPHDLRRTCATFMSELGVPRLIVSKILNHTDQSVDAIYDRHSYIPEKKDALQKWNDELDLILEGNDNILIFNKKIMHTT